MSDTKSKLLEYLKAHDLIVIASQGERPAAATVYYGVDDDFNFYIITPPSTEHGKNFEENHKVAAVVVDTNQKQFKTEKKVGVQIYGTVNQVTDVAAMKNALFVWSKGKEDIVETYVKNISENIYKSRLYVIQPTEIKWFNEELYGPEGTEIFTF